MAAHLNPLSKSIPRSGFGSFNSLHGDESIMVRGSVQGILAKFRPHFGTSLHSRVMVRGMLSPFHQFQIFKAIILTIAIFVMDTETFGNRPMLFLPKMPMFSGTFPIQTEDSVSFLERKPSESVWTQVRICITILTKPLPVLTAKPAGDMLSATAENRTHSSFASWKDNPQWISIPVPSVPVCRTPSSRFNFLTASVNRAFIHGTEYNPSRIHCQARGILWL